MDAAAETVLDAETIARIIRRMASEMLERIGPSVGFGIVGVQRGGTAVAARLAAEIAKVEPRQIPVGALDITLYRDDSATALRDPKVGPSRIEWDVEGSDIVLVDDVLHTGRTIRAAIDCLFDYGRPRRIWLAVLCDRAGRQLPIAADFVGRSVEVPAGFVLDVSAEGGQSDGAWLRAKRADGV
jgi:pyrimidine operon attenuation protein/uracil phosphoribosyltransferase